MQVERARRAIRVFVLMRRLSLAISGEPDSNLPLMSVQQCISVNDVLDLSQLRPLIITNSVYRRLFNVVIIDFVYTIR